MLVDLCGSMPQYSLERNHELHGVKVVDVVVPMSREACPARNHEPYVGIEIEVVIINAKISRTLMLVMSNIFANMLTC